MSAPEPVGPPCGITRHSPSYEWICVASVHDDGNRSHRRDQRGYIPKSERHWFVRRYPESEH